MISNNVCVCVCDIPTSEDRDSGRTDDVGDFTSTKIKSAAVIIRPEFQSFVLC